MTVVVGPFPDGDTAITITDPSGLSFVTDPENPTVLITPPSVPVVTATDSTVAAAVDADDVVTVDGPAVEAVLDFLPSDFAPEDFS